MVILLIIFGILLELIVIAGGVYLFLKHFKKEPIMADKIEIEKKETVIPDGIYSNTSQEEAPIESGGELIPFNLTDGERELLRMFYSKND